MLGLTFHNHLEEGITVELDDTAPVYMPPKGLTYNHPTPDEAAQRRFAWDPQQPYARINHIFGKRNVTLPPPGHGTLVVPADVAQAHPERSDLVFVDEATAWRDVDGLHVVTFNRIV